MDKIKVEPDLLLNLDRNINDSHSMIKCEAEEELTNNIVVKNEYDFYDNETFVDEGNFQSTQGISCGARAFVDRLLNDNVIRGSRAFQSAGYECINEEIVEYEQNYHSENQVLSKVKQESDSEESTILKKEIEFVDVQENNELVDHCLYDEKKIWNNITGGFTKKTPKTHAERQKEYRQRQKIKKIEGESTKKTPKTHAERQKAYEQRQQILKNENNRESIKKIPKTHAERQKAYWQRQKIKKEGNNRESTKKTPKTHAERQKAYRQRQKMFKNENNRESTKKTPKSHAERQKEYRQRLKILKNENKRESNAILNAPPTTERTNSE